MSRTLPIGMGVLLAVALAAFGQSVFAAGEGPKDEFAQKATWQAPSAAEVRLQIDAWLTERQADEAAKKAVEELWAAGVSNISGRGVLDLTAASIAAVDPAAKPVVELCAHPREAVVTPRFDWLRDDKTTPFVRNNLRLLMGRWLVQERMYDEAFEQLDGLKTEDVVDPATLLFHQGIVHHRMLNRDAGLTAIDRLLEKHQELPRRYESVAKLMQADLSTLKPESLDHIARRMDDVRRRLDLGRAGPKVREVEDGIIKSLDKMIKEMEDAAAAAAAAAAKAGQQQQIRSSSPAQDSTPMGGKGPGEVARKNIGSKSGWGDLPPKQREEALQQIGKDYPAHYRDVIEQYFRKLASEERE